MHRFVFGLIAGVLLSALRAPDGLDLFSLPAAAAETRYAVRALALAAIAIAAVLARQMFDGERTNGSILVGVAAGFIGYGATRAGLWGQGWIALFASPAVMILLTALWLDPRSARGASEEKEGARPAEAATLFGLFLGGAGASIAIEGIARHMRLLGAGTFPDDTVFGGVFLLLAAFGGLAFGSFFKAMRGDRARSGLSLACLPLAAVSGLVSLMSLASVASSRDLDRFVRRFDMNTAEHGMLHLSALLAAPVFVLPAFFAGTALYGARRQGELGGLALGAAFGLIAIPLRLGLGAGEVDFESAAYGALLVRDGALLAAFGALVAAVFSGPLTGRPARIAVGVIAAVSAGIALSTPISPLPICAPWAVIPVQPELSVDSSEGLLTVEPSSEGFLYATLNRRPLTPPLDAAKADAQRFRFSWELLPEDALLGGVDVLLIGQLTAGRALELTGLGARRIDRTGAWYEAMAGLEARLFEGAKVPSPLGSILSPAEARAKFELGEYELVIVPPVPGQVPRVPAVDPPEGTLVVAWLDGSQFLAGSAPEAAVLLSAEFFDELSLGFVFGAEPANENAEQATGEPRFVNTGAAATPPSPLTWLRSMDFRREFRARAALAERIGSANRGTAVESLALGLSQHYAVQKHSSPFESRAQKVELDPESLANLRDAALAGPPDPFTREVWVGLAEILVGKRAIGEIYEYLEPVAEAWKPWFEGELALAHADYEALEYESAIARLEALAEERPMEPLLREFLAGVHSDAGQHDEAAELLRELFRAEPDTPALRRKLGIELFHAGNPEGRAILESVLAADPEDEEVAALLDA